MSWLGSSSSIDNKAHADIDDGFAKLNSRIFTEKAQEYDKERMKNLLS
tara:strand:+ start:612 stop:755 length:144 start_codon:yes stop_codon:yes gene_type:complete